MCTGAKEISHLLVFPQVPQTGTLGSVDEGEEQHLGSLSLAQEIQKQAQGVRLDPQCNQRSKS